MCALCVLFSTVTMCIFLLISLATGSMVTQFRGLLGGKNYFCCSPASFIPRDDT